MKIYLLMNLNDVLGEKYYTNEDEIKKIVEEAKKNHGGDFWYKTLTNNEDNYEKMAKSFIGETITDFFCNGFFGSRNYDLRGSEITKVYHDDDKGIVIEILKMNKTYDYGYFSDGWDEWKCVYEHLQEWVK